MDNNSNEGKKVGCGCICMFALIPIMILINSGDLDGLTTIVCMIATAAIALLGIWVTGGFKD